MCWLHGTIERPFSSTTYPKRQPKMVSPRQGESGAPKARSWLSLGRRDWRRALALDVRYIGATSDGWVEVRSRGVTKRFPNETCLLKLLSDINGR